MNDPLAVKVRIRNSEGRYLTGGASSGFSDEPSKAIIFDYLRHQVAEQLEEIRRTRGILLEAVPVEPAEVYETCDHCHKLVSPFDTFFDGSGFLCFGCLAQVSLVSEAQVTQAARAFQAFTANGNTK
jgi:hypothetical protein